MSWRKWNILYRWGHCYGRQGQSVYSSWDGPKAYSRDGLAIEALGSMMWYLRQLNTDKEIMSMKNFNVYDPGQGLTQDGQTLAHLEVLRSARRHAFETSWTMGNSVWEDFSGSGYACRCMRFPISMLDLTLCRILWTIQLSKLVPSGASRKVFLTWNASWLVFMLRTVVSKSSSKCLVLSRRGMAKLADKSESFESKTIFGLLHICYLMWTTLRFKPINEDADELIPQEGKDEMYDKVVSEIDGLEQSLELDLKKLLG